MDVDEIKKIKEFLGQKFRPECFDWREVYEYNWESLIDLARKSLDRALTSLKWLLQVWELHVLESKAFKSESMVKIKILQTI